MTTMFDKEKPKRSDIEAADVLDTELPLTQSIAARLLRIIFACYFLVTLIVTVAQLAAEYQHTKSRLLSEIAAMQNTFGPGIADAMWRYNDDILRGILSGMSQLPVVVGIKVEDENGNFVRAVGTILDHDGKRVIASLDGRIEEPGNKLGLFADMFSREFPVVYTDEAGNRRTIGKWIAYSDQQIVVNQVEYGFFLILVNSIIKTLALWFIFLFIVQRYLGKPLRQLSEFVGRLNIDNLGDSTFTLKDHGRHELHLLANKVNEMTAKLRASLAEKTELFAQLRDEQAKIRALNESLERRVAERTEELTRDRQELAKANRELAEALDTLKRAHEELGRSERLAALGSMVAGVAHELNTPIGNSLTVASTLQDEVQRFAGKCSAGLKRSDVDRFLADTLQASELLTRNILRSADLVSNFKQVAVDQTSSLRRQFFLDKVVEENITALSPSIKKRPFVLTQSVPANIQMDSFPGPLGQVLFNLINNAILHGFDDRSDGTIIISAREAQTGWVELLVNDNGGGIAPENLKRIFDPFFTTKLGSGSCGLGLSIVHNIVTTILGGRIHVRSAIGSGTTFEILLPLTAPSVQQEQAAIS